MIKLTVLYTPPTDAEAFEAHYLSAHMPLANALPGLMRSETSVCVATPDGSPVPYHRIAELYFEDAATMGSAFASELGQKTAADAQQLAVSTGSSVTMVVGAID